MGSPDRRRCDLQGARETGSRWVTVARGGGSRLRSPDRRSLDAKPSDQIGEVQCEKKREQRLSRESRLEREKHACFGKWFTEKFSANHFPYFTL
jgi:hypothetical protein